MQDLVVITGAAGGIGKELCLAFGKMNFGIIALDTNLERLEDLGKILDNANISFSLSHTDITKLEKLNQDIEHCKKSLGGQVKALINNAAINIIGPFNTSSIQGLQKMMEVNLMGAVNCTAVCLKDLNENNGTIINVSTTAGFAPLYHRTSYCCTKYALHGFFESLRTESSLKIIMAIPTYVKTGFGAAKNDEKGIKLLSPKFVASEIYKAYENGKETVYIGFKSLAARKLYLLAPKLFVKLMLKEQKVS
ncbi:MAG: SDR family NAD(P)-dependent oxidoreductase [Flavobacteriales bacterium]|nr:SDR family NAD(P)-dependent oxidoreductase [Flavobacteriales bacterium]